MWCASCIVVVSTCFVICGWRVCVGFVMCGCFDNCVGILVICVLVFTVFLYFFLLCIFILICY